MINYELLKKTTLEDYQRRIDKVIKKISEIECKDKSGLLQRILNFDRQLLHSCMGYGLTNNCTKRAIEILNRK